MEIVVLSNELENGLFKENQIVSIMDDENCAKAVRPPRNFPVVRHCISQATLADASKSSTSGENSGFVPVFRSGSCSEKGSKSYIEDEYVCVDNLGEHFDQLKIILFLEHSMGIYYGGIDAAVFTRKKILKFILEDCQFSAGVKRAIKNAFMKADYALADAKSLDRSSGTTALIALMLGRNMIIANAGDSRAVLGKRGRAIEMSKDHKPNCTSERFRIEKLGGVIYDGYLNGQLSVARALGDWHMKGSKGSNYLLSSEPELEEVVLTEEDEFLMIGCEGLWDVMSSQYDVTIVRKKLMQHNNPEKCSTELVREAIKHNTCDNLTVES